MHSNPTDNMYAIAERFLSGAAVFSLVIAVLIEAKLMVTKRYTNPKIQYWLRHGLVSLLIINSLLSLGSLVLFSVIQFVSHRSAALVQQGTGLEPDHPSYGAVDVGDGIGYGTWEGHEGKRIVPWQLSSLAIFAFSVILLVSACLDMREIEQGKEHQGSREKKFGEKGKIYL